MVSLPTSDVDWTGQLTELDERLGRRLPADGIFTTVGELLRLTPRLRANVEVWTAHPGLDAGWMQAERILEYPPRDDRTSTLATAPSGLVVIARLRRSPIPLVEVLRGIP